MKVKAEVFKELFNKEDFYILALRPIEKVEGMELSKYGTFTLKGDYSYLTVGETYDLDVDLLEVNQYGASYVLRELPDLGFDTLDDKREYEILCEITTPTQARYVNDAYGNFIRLVLEGREDEIDVKKIYNIKEKRKNFLIREITRKLKFYIIKRQFSAYDLSLKECKELNVEYKSLDEMDEALKDKPYYVLIDVLKRSFTKSDKTILSISPDFIDSDMRTEYAMLEILNQNERDRCSTRMSAREMAYYAKDLAPECLSKMKDVAINGNLIHYCGKTNLIAKADTYEAECEIAYDLKTRLKNNVLLDMNWQGYKTIKDGELIEEQSNFLKMFTENNVLVLTAGSGTGKSSSVMALLDMLDDYSTTYTLVTPSGKSAKRLSQQTNRKASTIHRAIGYGGEPREINTDVLFIDESGMCGVDLTQMLLRQTSNQTRVVFIGDIQQIPSISLGNVLKDLINSGEIPVCRLSFCFRFKEGGLSQVSALMAKGDFYLDNVDGDRITMGNRKDYTFVKSDGTMEQVLHEYQLLLDRGIKPKDICVITPINVRSMGSVEINNQIQAMINPARPNEVTHTRKWQTQEIKFRPRDLILVCKNNYKTLTYDGYMELKRDNELEASDVETTDVYNGEVGKVLSTDDNAIIIQIDEKMVVYMKEDFDNLMLGYSLNSYKMQGSEVPYVIMVTDKSYGRVLNRNIQYTTATRARQEVIEIGDIKSIKEALDKNASDDRDTWLCELLKEIN